MAQQSDTKATELLRHFVMFAVCGYLLLWVAILNGYPVFYDDTGEYLLDSFRLMQSPYRSILYSVFIRLVSLGIDPWLVIVGQSAITVYVLHCTFEYIVQKRPAMQGNPVFFPGLVILLAFGTGLPWYVGQIMPDVFSGLAFLSAFLLLYDAQAKEGRKVLLSIVLGISIGCHLSNFLSIGLVIVAVLALRGLKNVQQLWPVLPPKGIIAFVLVPILASAGTIAMSNYSRGFGFRLSAGTPIFLMGRLIESGLAVDYLEQECRVEQLTPCKDLGELRGVPRNDFLWGPYPLLKEMGEWTGAGPEAQRIVYGTIRRYPFRFAVDCIKQTYRQFVLFKGDDENYAIRGYALEVFERLYPGEVGKYKMTRQWSGRLAWIARRIHLLYKAVFWVCFGCCVAFLILGWPKETVTNRLFLITFIFLAANALVTGAVSGVENRYQGRVNWIVVLCCAAYVAHYLGPVLGAARPKGTNE